MKILTISAGLTPKRSGGLPAYVADCLQALRQRGHTLFYLDTNCKDSSRQPRIEPDPADSFSFRFFNTGAELPFGGPLPAPLSDMRACREVEHCFLGFVEKIAPQIIHFLETACLPMALISRLRQLGYKLVFTAADYLPVCPTIQLLRDDLQVCRLKTDQLQCHRCIRKWPHAQFNAASSWIERAIMGIWPPARKIAMGILRRFGPALDRLLVPLLYRSSDYKKRREAALEHLRSFHLILCISKLKHEILLDLLEAPELLRQIYISRRTYRDTPLEKSPREDGAPIRFVGLNINQSAKGRDLLLQEFRALRLEGMEGGEAELHLFGQEGASGEGVFFHGAYNAEELDGILAPMDVGIVPSLWPESYGFVGPEMLSRGIPLIVSCRGAMREYVEPGVNGLWFDPSEPGGLKQAMKTLAGDPRLLLKLTTNAPLGTKGIVKFADHIDEMESIYRELIALPCESE